MAPRRILLVRLSALGDVLQTLPALAALRRGRPDAELAWLVEDRHAGVVEGHPDLDRVFVFRRRDLAREGRMRVLSALRRELRDFAPDVAVDLQGNLKGATLARLSGAPRRIGLPRGEAREGASFFATECPAPGAEREHRADRALRLVAALGAQPGVPPRLPPLETDVVESIDTALTARGIDEAPILLVPGTSEFGRFKRWPTERFGELGRRLAQRLGRPVLVTAGPGEDELADAVVRHADGHVRRAPPTASLAHLRALFDRAALVVGADSGPVLLAATGGTPTVALYGPKDPAVYAPRGPHVAVAWKRVYCSPCILRRCGDPICMTELTVDEVWPAVARALGSAQEDAA